MNDSETNPMTAEISDQIAALKRQTFSLLLALVVVSGTLTVYLYRQASVTRHDIADIKPRATQLINAYKQNSPAMQNFVKQLEEFAKSHPDFLPVLEKNRIVSAPAASGASVRKPAKK